MTDLANILVSNTFLASALAALALLATLCRRSPQVVHVLWLLVLVKLITPPMFDVAVPGWEATVTTRLASDSAQQPEPTPTAAYVSQEVITEDLPFEPDPEPAVTADSGSDDWLNRPHVATPSVPSIVPPAPVDPASQTSTTATWLTLLPVLSLAGSLVYLVLLCCRCMLFRQVVRCANPAPGELQATASRLAERVRLKRCPRIVIVDARVPPLVWSLSRQPLLVLPRELLESLSLRQLQSVLFHELVHIRRGDHRLRWFDSIVMTLLWWHPLVWLARSRMRRAEEECCDAWVVWAFPESRREYGEALLRTVEFLTERPGLVPAASTPLAGNELKRRVDVIVNKSIRHRMSRWSLVVVLVLAVASLPVQAQREASQQDSGDDEVRSVRVEQTRPAERILPRARQLPPVQSQKQQTNNELMKRLERLEAMVAQLVEVRRPVQATSSQVTRRAAVSSDGKYVATLTVRGETSDVEIFSAASGKLMSRSKLNVAAKSMGFEGDTLQVMGRSTVTHLAVPDGRTVSRAYIRPPARSTTQATLPPARPTTLPPARKVATNANAAALQSAKFETLLEEYKQLRADVRTRKTRLVSALKLHQLELELEEAKLATAKASLDALKESDAAAVEIRKSELEVTKARIGVEKAKAQIVAEESQFRNAERSLVETEEQLKEMIKLTPAHPIAKEYIRLREKRK